VYSSHILMSWRPSVLVPITCGLDGRDCGVLTSPVSTGGGLEPLGMALLSEEDTSACTSSMVTGHQAATGIAEAACGDASCGIAALKLVAVPVVVLELALMLLGGEVAEAKPSSGEDKDGDGSEDGGRRLMGESPSKRQRRSRTCSRT